MLPAVAQDARIPLSLVTSWIEMGGAGGIVAGLVLGRFLYDKPWHDLPWIWSGVVAGSVPRYWPAPAGISAGRHLFCRPASRPSRFPCHPSCAEQRPAATGGGF